MRRLNDLLTIKDNALHERDKILKDKKILKDGMQLINVSRPQLRVWNIRLSKLRVILKKVQIELDEHPQYNGNADETKEQQQRIHYR